MELQTMSTSELLALYNKSTGKGVKRFADRKTALKRVAEALKTSKPRKASIGTGKRRRGFNFPLVKGGAKSIREGTNRGTLVTMLRKGASFAACVEKAGFKDERNTYQAIRLLHTYCGYGLTQGEDGVIHLVE